MNLTPHGNHYRDEHGHQFPRVTSILKATRIAVYPDFGDKELGFARGSAVHKATELDDNGTLKEASVEPEIMPYLKAWRDFRKDTGLHLVENERKVCSVIYGFAGTLDRVGIMGGKRVIIDIKTGAKNAATGIQLAAYELAYCEQFNMCRGHHRFAVHLTSEGKYKIVEYDNHGDRNTFLSALTVYRWQHREGIE